MITRTLGAVLCNSPCDTEDNINARDEDNATPWALSLHQFVETTYCHYGDCFQSLAIGLIAIFADLGH